MVELHQDYLNRKANDKFTANKEALRVLEQIKMKGQ